MHSVGWVEGRVINTVPSISPFSSMCSTATTARSDGGANRVAIEYSGYVEVEDMIRRRSSRVTTTYHLQ